VERLIAYLCRFQDDAGTKGLVEFMEESRRRVLLLGLGLFVAGCSSKLEQQVQRPDIDWPDSPNRPRPTGKPIVTQQPRTTTATTTRTTTTQSSAQVQRPVQNPVVAQQPAPTAQASPQLRPLMAVNSNLDIRPRTRWADQGPLMDRITPMGQVERITIHHEGWNPVVFTDEETTAERLELIRRSHIQRLGAGDIGYHFVIDRAGRVWQGRDVRYQGAHVRGNNQNNIGVMCLGNFDIQSPSPQQLQAMIATIRSLRTFYKVPVREVKTHQEINPTACPGKSLQPFIAQARASGKMG
jgi:hypothetical protein